MSVQCISLRSPSSLPGQLSGIRWRKVANILKCLKAGREVRPSHPSIVELPLEHPEPVGVKWAVLS